MVLGCRTFGRIRRGEHENLLIAPVRGQRGKPRTRGGNREILSGSLASGREAETILIENTLFGEKDKVADAIKLLQENEPEEGYYVAFSGGKDSTVVLDLVRRAGVKYDAHYNLTTVDPPELIYFIREHYPEIWENRIRPKMSMWELIVKYKIPPTRTIRYCCKELKEKGGVGRFVVTGIRAQESKRRAKREQIENGRKQNKRFIHPIFEWTETDIWDYIHSNNLPYCKLYDEGRTRIGCILCPYQRRELTKDDMQRYPKYVEAYKTACNKALEILIAEGKTTTWKQKDDMFNWWVRGRASVPCMVGEDEIPLFSDGDF